MGGNHLGVGNVSRCAEFNFWSDPEAAHITIAESKCPVYILPWEACLEASKTTPLKEWRMNILSSNGNFITNFMDPIEKNVQVDGNFIPCDAYLTCCFLVPQMIKRIEHVHATVELGGNFTRGQMVIDHKRRRTIEKPNVFVIQQIDAEMFKNFLLCMCGHKNSESI